MGSRETGQRPRYNHNVRKQIRRSAESRATERRHWPVQVHRLGEEPDEDLTATTTAEERLDMMWTLAMDAWSHTGQPLPRYARADLPIRVRTLRSDPTA